MIRLGLAALLLPLIAPAQPLSGGAWEKLTEKDARRTLLSTRVNGQVGKSWDTRILSTERSFNYKLRATWITRDVAAAAARLLVLMKGASSLTAENLIREFTLPSWHYVFIEIDPREGSGVIPRDWIARFGPSGNESQHISGEIIPEQDPWRTYVSVFPRNYDYDIFLVRFPTRTSDGAPLLDSTIKEAELAVRIHEKVGRVRWSILAGSDPLTVSKR